MQPKSHMNMLIGASGPAEVLFNACWPHTEIFLPETLNICVDNTKMVIAAASAIAVKSPVQKLLTQPLGCTVSTLMHN